MPGFRRVAAASTRARRYISMNTWFGESDGPRRYRGWRKAVVAAALITAVVLLANVILAITAAARYGTDAGIGVLYVGDCGLVERWNTALHLLINVLGTCLLCASSFTMQCLSSPSRSETDRAHSLRKPLDVGVPSLKNLFYMHRWKACLWWGLCLSTLPLHLFWNSTVFSTIGANEFNYLVVEESFLSGTEYLAPVVLNYTGSEVSKTDVIDPAIYLDGYKQGKYRRMEVEQCIDTYLALFVTSYRKFIAVATPQAGMKMSPGALFPTFKINLTEWYGDYWDAYSLDPEADMGYPQPLWNGSSVLAFQWFLGTRGSGTSAAATVANQWPCIGWNDFYNPTDLSTCNKEYAHGQLQQNGTWWLRPWEHTALVDYRALQAYPINYCLVEDQDVQQCQLQYVSYILILVICCNIIKLGCMSATAHYLWHKDEPIFATIGDAVSSYMERPDETTANWCLMDLTSSKVWQRQKLNNDKRALNGGDVDVYQRKPTLRLLRATSETRWWTTILLCVLYLIIGICLLFIATDGLKHNNSGLKSVLSAFGLGKVTDMNLLNFRKSSALMRSIFSVNSFQLVLSITYFLFNSLWTAQCSAIEWASYVAKRKPLRVTWPRGQQRSTSYLNLPYQYDIPLTVMLTLLHFLISQSIFLARVQYYKPDGSPSDDEIISAAAYSPLGILITVCVASALILALVGNSFRKIDNRMPVHGNSSAVISAMCHTRKGLYQNDQGVALEHPEQDMSERHVKWGVIRQADVSFDFKNDVSVNTRDPDMSGHCAFSADEVDPPEFGQRYR